MRAIRPGVASATAGVSAREGSASLTPFARDVLDVVAAIPAGKVMTYGDVADHLGRGGARTVGAVMSRLGHEVPWHRVVQANGRPAEPLYDEALRLLAREGCPLDGGRVRLSMARWDGVRSR